MILAGKKRLVVVNGAATVLTLECRPPIGIEWIVLGGGVRHDDGSARTLYLTWKDADLGIEFDTAGKSMTGGHIYPLGGDIFSSTVYGNLFNSPPILTNDIYFIVTANALAAGKSLEIDLVVIERPEDWELRLEEQKARVEGYGLNIASRE